MSDMHYVYLGRSFTSLKHIKICHIATANQGQYDKLEKETRYIGNDRKKDNTMIKKEGAGL